MSRTLLEYKIKDKEPVIVDVSGWDDSSILSVYNPEFESFLAITQTPFGVFKHLDPDTKGWKFGTSFWTPKKWHDTLNHLGPSLAEQLDDCRRAIIGWQRSSEWFASAKEAERSWPKLLKKVQHYETVLRIHGFLK
jgi:hypothetical protein